MAIEEIKRHLKARNDINFNRFDSEYTGLEVREIGKNEDPQLGQDVLIEVMINKQVIYFRR